MIKVKNLIIGAGPTGLGTGYRFTEQGENDFLIVEKNTHSGGLASTFIDNKGFLWDIGGHVQFSHYEYFDNVMRISVKKWLKHQRESWVWMFDKFIPYPFQNNIHKLPRKIFYECLKGIIKIYKYQNSKLPENFEEWIDQNLGEGIKKYFMLPYNYKVWGFHPKKLNINWVGERAALVDLERIVQNALDDRDDVSWGPNNTFQFPLKGGTGAIWKAVAKLIPHKRFMYSSQVEFINIEKKEALINTPKGKIIISFENCINTSPLDKFMYILGSLKNPQLLTNMSVLAAGLKHSSTHIIGIGVEGRPSKELKTKCWMYFPEDNCPFYRVTLFSKYSPYNTPDDKKYYSLMTETSSSSDKKMNLSSLVNDTVKGLKNTKLIPKNAKIVTIWNHKESYGYPTPSTERDSILKEVIPYLENFNIYSRGRFGLWKYEVSNQDHSFMQGVEIANRLMYNVNELTAFYPSLVNGR